MEDNYEIKTAQFEGPFDLLLFFIERDELDINEISIASITQDFLLFIQKWQQSNMEIASEFIYVAATLMRIKVKTLLPRQVSQEDSDEVDPQQDLIQKLILYKRFKLISEDLRALENERLLLHTRANTAVTEDLKKASEKNREIEELSSLDLYKLMLVYERLMKNFQNRNQDARHVVIQYPYTIEKQKELIANLVQINKKLDFDGILQKSENKVQFVYNFLAVLEMLQQQLIDIQIGLGYNNFWVEAKSDSF